MDAPMVAVHINWQRVLVNGAVEAARHCRQHPDSASCAKPQHDAEACCADAITAAQTGCLQLQPTQSEQAWASLLHASPSNEPKLMPPVAAKGSHLEAAAEYWLCQVLQHAHSKLIRHTAAFAVKHNSSAIQTLVQIRSPPAPMKAILVSEPEVAKHLAPFAAGLTIALVASTS